MFHRNRSKTLIELAERVEKYIDTKEFLRTKDPEQANVDHSWKKRKKDLSEKHKGKRLKKHKLRSGQK